MFESTKTPVTATAIVFGGVIPKDQWPDCSAALSEIHTRAAGLYCAELAPELQEIVVIGAEEDAQALKEILTFYGLQVVSERPCPEMVNAHGKVDMAAIIAWLLVTAKRIDIVVDLPECRPPSPFICLGGRFDPAELVREHGVTVPTVIVTITDNGLGSIESLLDEAGETRH